MTSKTCGCQGSPAGSSAVCGQRRKGKRLEVVEAQVLGFRHDLLKDLADAVALGAVDSLDE